MSSKKPSRTRPTNARIAAESAPLPKTLKEVQPCNSSDERAFFVAMGERIASLRKARNLTQTQLAEALGVTQQTVQAYEAGSWRIPVSTLPVVACTLSVSLMLLFVEEQEKGEKATARKRGPVPQWQQHIEAIARLPRSRQQFVAEMLRNVLGEGAAR